MQLLLQKELFAPKYFAPWSVQRGAQSLPEDVQCLAPGGAQGPIRFSHDISICRSAQPGLIQLSLCVGTILHTAIPTTVFLT